MSDYNCLVAGLPDVSMEEGRLTYSTADFKEEIYPRLTPRDRHLIDLFYLSWDNSNLLALLDNPDKPLAHSGRFDASRLKEMMAWAKEGNPRPKDFPSYLYIFLTSLYEHENGTGLRPREDLLAAYYYDYAIHCHNPFVSQWFTFNLNVNNILVAMTARKYKLNVADSIIGDSEVCEALRTSGARDFGLSSTLDYIEAVQHIAEMEELDQREKKLDQLRWRWLDDNSVFYYFSVERLFVFLQKLDIAHRWAAMDKEKGTEVFNSVVHTLKEEIRVPDEFLVK